jgi:DNA repair ATPase RecN
MKLFLILSFIIAACSNNPSENADFVSTDFEESTVITQEAPPSEKLLLSEDISQKLVRTGSINFQSEDIEKDYSKIKSMLGGFNAYLENENQFNDNYRKSYNLQIRVPSEKYDSLLQAIAKIAYRVESKNSNVDDVTERYYDLQSRIQNKKELEIRYREILSKANQVKDILEIERNLNEVRSDIEMMEGQFNYLSKQINSARCRCSFMKNSLTS